MTKSREWYTIRNTAETVEIDIYGPIGQSWMDDDAVSAKAVLDAINEAKGKPIDLHVNSEGGSVFDAFAMFTALQNYDGHVTAYVDGLAASAASYLIAAADEVVMGDVAWLMIHEASGMVWGNKHAMRKEAEVLDNIDATIARIYDKRGTLSADQWLELMAEETWLDAETAQEYGLADRLTEALPKVARAMLDYRAEMLEGAPEALMDALPHERDTAECDTFATIEETNDDIVQEDEVDSVQERAFVVIDGRIYDRKDN